MLLLNTSSGGTPPASHFTMCRSSHSEAESEIEMFFDFRVVLEIPSFQDFVIVVSFRGVLGDVILVTFLVSSHFVRRRWDSRF